MRYERDWRESRVEVTPAMLKAAPAMYLALQNCLQYLYQTGDFQHTNDGDYCGEDVFNAVRAALARADGIEPEEEPSGEEEYDC